MSLSRLLILVLVLTTTTLFAQEEIPKNWPHLDFQKDGYPGMSTERAYKELLSDRQSETVIVAVLDSGIDYEHEDLKDIMWVNEDEIPGNGIDDDKNGYVDDIRGWNFIGGKDGNLEHETLEMTRLYAKYKKQFEGKDAASLSAEEKAQYDKYLEWGKVIEEKRAEAAPNIEMYGGTFDAFKAVAEAIGKDPDDITLEDMQNLESDDPNLPRIADAIAGMITQNDESFGSLYGQIKELFDYYNSQLAYHYNPEYDGRKIVGDNPDDPTERYYGNNDVEGADASHGTHVAGIIGAIRNNGIGVDGVADNIRIMSIRTVPDGDERDKDVANAIRYAVDNGAKVINMSFGKGESPDKGVVDDAIRYAMKNDVLLVHGSGNDNSEVFYQSNFPNDQYEKKKLFRSRFAENWIEVGANTPYNDERLPADFSNYSQNLVDVFAPGVEIYSTVPDDKYKLLQGTSMASPMVAGLAALLRSYFPELTAAQVKDIIMTSAVRYKGKVNEPGTGELVNFSTLSVTGGLANVYEAVKLALMTKGRNRA